MREKIDSLCAERDRVRLSCQSREGTQRAQVVRYFGDDPNPPPFIKALAEVRHFAAREGWCYQHVQAISAAIDQYAEKALCNRYYFLNKPYGIGGRNEDVP